MSIFDTGTGAGTGPGKKYFYLNLAVLSMIFSFYFLVSSREPANNGKDILLYLSSGVFAAWFCVMAAAAFALFIKLSGASGLDRDTAAEKKIFLILAVLFVLSVVLSFFRNVDRGWHALFNGMFALALGVIYFRLGSFKGINIKPEEKWPFYLLCLAASVFIVIACASGFLSQNSFSTFPKDMGIFNNLAWRIGEDGSQFSVLEDLNDHRGVHFQPVLYLLALIFKLKCSPYILIFLQAFFALGASVFLYLLAAKLLKNAGAAFFIALAFLTSTYTARTFIYDYHPESMYMMMFFAFMYFSERGIFPAAAAFLCLAAGIKEEAAVYMALASLYVFTANKDKKYLVLSIFSFIYAAVVIYAVMPSYNSASGSWWEAALQNSANLLNPELGGGLLFQFLIFLFSAAFLPLLSVKPLLLIFLPPVLVHFANYRDPSHLLFNMWYASFVTPALFAGVIYALKKKAGENRVFAEQLVLIAAVLFILQAQFQLAFMSVFSPVFAFASGAITLVIVFFPFVRGIKSPKAGFPIFVLAALAVFYFGYFDFHKSRMGDVPKQAKASIKKAMQFIPASGETAVMTNSNIVTHLCCRKYVWAIDTGTAEDVFRPVLRERLNLFYMLVYLYDYTYTDNKIAPDTRNREIAALAKKYGFTYGFLYNDNITGVLIFTRKPDTIH